MLRRSAVVKAIGVIKNRDKDVVSGRNDVGRRKNFYFLNFSPKSLGNTGRLFQYRLLVVDLPFFIVLLLVTCVSLWAQYLTVCLHLSPPSWRTAHCL